MLSPLSRIFYPQRLKATRIALTHRRREQENSGDKTAQEQRKHA